MAWGMGLEHGERGAGLTERVLPSWKGCSPWSRHLLPRAGTVERMTFQQRPTAAFSNRRLIL